jgi:hypothetical protein
MELYTRVHMGKWITGIYLPIVPPTPLLDSIHLTIAVPWFEHTVRHSFHPSLELTGNLVQYSTVQASIHPHSLSCSRGVDAAHSPIPSSMLGHVQNSTGPTELQYSPNHDTLPDPNLPPRPLAACLLPCGN